MSIDCLVIDEVAMLTPELLEKLDYIARNIRINDFPFGGIQVVLSSDFYQLPPVNKSENKNEDGEIINKGISQRQFARSFTIADDVKVSGAELNDGLLTIACERIVPDYKKKKLIEIK